MKSDPYTFQYFSYEYDGLFLPWPVRWWHAVSCIFSCRVKLKVLWEGTPWRGGMKGGDVCGTSSEGCVGGIRINTFSRPRTAIWNSSSFLLFLVSSMIQGSRRLTHWSRWCRTGDAFFHRCDTLGSLRLCLFFLVVRSQMEIMTCITSEFDRACDRCAGFGFLPAH